MQILYVGLGGFTGAVLRYLFSLVFATSNSPFPIVTLLINLVGSFLIGLITAYTGEIAQIDPKVLLFLTTGLCGGFTTFSTFSLETTNLLSAGKIGLGILYATLSVLLCVLGIFLAKLTVAAIAAK